MLVQHVSNLLDVAKLDAGKMAQAVQTDMAAGKKLGVTGTPTFFINGRNVTGAQPLEAFVKIIDEELKRSPSAPAR